MVGRIQTGSYTNQQGDKVYTTDVVVEDQEFAESKAASQNSQPTAPPQNAYQPQAQPAPMPQQQYQQGYAPQQQYAQGYAPQQMPPQPQYAHAPQQAPVQPQAQPNQDRMNIADAVGDEIPFV